MKHLPCPELHVRALARLLGESERSVRLLLQGGLVLAALLSLAWLAGALDGSLLPAGNEGSAQVVHAFTGLLAAVCASVTAGLAALGRWQARGG